MIFNHAQELIRYVEGCKSMVIGITSGCFDLLHPLHVEYLNKCKNECDELYVLIDSDSLVRKNKNKTPLINEYDRAYMVDSLKAVNGTLVFTHLIELEALANAIGMITDVLVFKHDEHVYGKKLLQFSNSRVKNFIVPDVIKFQSTTEITNHLKQQTE